MDAKIFMQLIDLAIFLEWFAQDFSYLTPLRDCNLCNEVFQLLAPPSLVFTAAAQNISLDLNQKPQQKPLKVTFVEED